jgi:hypothetical protein
MVHLPICLECDFIAADDRNFFPDSGETAVIAFAQEPEEVRPMAKADHG